MRARARFARENKDLARMSRRHLREFTSFDPVEQSSLSTVLSTPVNDFHEFFPPADHVEAIKAMVQAFFERSSALDPLDYMWSATGLETKAAVKEAAKKEAAKKEAAKKEAAKKKNSAGDIEEDDNDGRQEEGQEQEEQEQEEVTVQRKILPWEVAVTSAEEEAGAATTATTTAAATGYEHGGGGGGATGQAAKRQLAEGRRSNDVIVVASLVDKVPNLAGLARTCEIFGAGLLVVPTKAVHKDPQFDLISVSASRWMPLAYVSEDDTAR